MGYAPIPDVSNYNDRVKVICNWIMGLKQHSENAHMSYRRRIPNIYALYRGIRTNQFHVHKNSIGIPLLYTICWSHAARIINMIFQQTPPIQFMGSGGTAEEAAIARKHDNLFNAQFRDARGMQKTLDLAVNANLYGTTITQDGWKFDKGKILVPDTTILPLSEEIAPILTEKEVINFDGPWFEIIDNLDAFPQPGVKHINDMRWFIRRYWLDFDQIEALSVPGGNREAIFDKREVARLKAEGGGAASAFDALKMQRGIMVYEDNSETARQREQYSKPVEIVEACGIHVPNEFAIDANGRHDGITYRTISVANGRYLLRNRPFSLPLNRKPYLAMSFNPDPHFFFAPGRGEVVQKLQLGVNKFTNQMLDALDVSIDPWFLFDRSANIDPRNLFLRPGRWIPMDGPPGERVMPGQVNMQGMTAAVETTQLLWQYMQRASGILDESVIGIRAPGRSTARGDLSRAEAVAVRLVLEALTLEKDWLEPMADGFMSYNKYYLQTPREFLILGQGAQMDTVTGQPMPKGRDVMMPGDMLPNYAARAIGTQTRMIQSGQVQDLLLMTQVLGQNPAVASAVDWISWVKLIGNKVGLGADINSVITQHPEAARLLAAAGGDVNNIPNLNVKEGTPGAVGNLNALSALAA